ncbi:hypothetical protein E0H26_12600 [Micromonospora zingiberis]|uniref:Uncharacterized protein n=1 Tax=Micromonospora zingiberis TaxID=2053011 RepID=A0A4R0GNC2_9ACTN|nr:hypothetical protein [Micromonospora zingiberis]TCB97129.1 hypothetical protein E0H26_12600 [Micromonospora zingiberis]
MSVSKPANAVPASRWGHPAPRTGFAVGDVIRVSEDAYLPGTGELRLYVAEVVGRTERDGNVWIEVYGHEVKEDRTLRIRRRYAQIRPDLADVLPARVR